MDSVVSKFSRDYIVNPEDLAVQQNLLKEGIFQLQMSKESAQFH